MSGTCVFVPLLHIRECVYLSISPFLLSISLSLPPSLPPSVCACVCMCVYVCVCVVVVCMCVCVSVGGTIRRRRNRPGKKTVRLSYSHV